MLVQWGYNKKSIHVDPDLGVLSVAGNEVLKVTVKDFVLTLVWSDGQWEQWGDLQKSAELATLKNNNQEKLDRAKANVSSAAYKGKGKGPEGSG